MKKQKLPRRGCGWCGGPLRGPGVMSRILHPSNGPCHKKCADIADTDPNRWTAKQRGIIGR